MRVDVLLFGPEAVLAGRRTVVVELDDRSQATCADLVRRLGEVVPALGPSLVSARVAVNQAFAAMDQVIHRDDEIALIGPVSGG